MLRTVLVAWLALAAAFVVVGTDSQIERKLDDRAAIEREAERLGLPVTRSVTRWYGIYVEGSKVGHARFTQEPVRREGRVFIRRYETQDATLQMEGKARGWFHEKELLYGAESPYRVSAGWSLTRMGDSERLVVLRSEPPVFQVQVTEGGRTRVLPIRITPSNWYEESEALAWFRTPRQVGQALAHGVYDLAGVCHYDIRTVTVRSIEERMLQGVPVTSYVADFRDKYSGDTGTMCVDSNGILLSQTFWGFAEIRLEPEHVAKARGQPVELFALLHATIATPLGDPSRIVELVLEVSAGDPDELRIHDGPNQRVSYDAVRKVHTVKLGAAHDPNVRASDLERIAALLEDGRYPIRDERVMALAAQAVGDASTPHEKVERLVAFVDSFIADVFTVSQLSVLDTIRERKGDCSEHAALFTTLARAVGVPARVVSGLAYCGDDYQHEGAYVFAGHAWNEVLLDGVWVPVDATWGQNRIDATHIRIRGGAAPGVSISALRGARLELISARRKP